MRDLVFISYSHNDYDKAILAEFKKNLDPAASRDLVMEWDDTQIKHGDDWMRGIEQALVG